MTDVESKMSSAVLHLEKELNSLRTSRANPAMVDNIFVDAYGSKTPLNQLGNISIQDASTITIQVWDTSLIKSIENAISESNLGINPQTDGQLIRLPIPKLSEERRKELIKIASEFAENSKVAIRNVRREFIEIAKKQKKDSNLSEDELKGVPTVCGSLREALDSLDKDRDFLKAGNVFTDNLIDSYIALKMDEVLQFEHTPHPVEFKMYYSV